MMVTRRETTPVDKGYAWVILCACSVLYMVLSGITKAFGILYTEFLQKYDSGAGNTAWIGSLQFFLLFAIAPLSNSLAETFSFRKVVMFGGLLVSAGYFISAFMPRMEWMYLTIGIIAGSGGGIVYAPCTTIVSFYFEKRRAFANGCVVAGSGLGSFVYPYLYRFLINTFGLQGALIIVGGVNLHICVAGALLRQTHQLTEKSQRRSNEMNKQELNLPLVDTNTKHPSEARKRFNINFKLLCNTRVILYITVFTVKIFAYAATFSVFPAHAESINIEKERIALALSMIGATEIFARPFFGWLADHKYLKKTTIMLFAAVVSGTCAMILPFLRNFPAMIVYGCVVGIFPGAFWSLMAVVMLDCVGLDKLTSALGLLYMFMSFSIVISQPIMGWLEDATGSWDLSFRVMGVTYFFSGAIVLIEYFIEKFRCVDHTNIFAQPGKMAEDSIQLNVQAENKL